MRRSAISIFCLALLNGCNSSTQPSPVAISAPEPEIARHTIENPQYQSWKSFPIGTLVRHRAVTRQEGEAKETITTATYKLIESTPAEVQVELQTKSVRFDGVESEYPSRTFRYPAQLQVPDLPTKKADEKGEEKIRVEEKEYATTWRKTKDRNEAGEVYTQVWSSIAVPGGFVKSIMRTPAIGATTTTELIEIRSPEKTPKN